MNFSDDLRAQWIISIYSGKLKIKTGWNPVTIKPQFCCLFHKKWRWNSRVTKKEKDSGLDVTVAYYRIDSIPQSLLPCGISLTPFKGKYLPLNMKNRRKILSSSAHLFSIQALNKKKYIWIINISSMLVKWNIVPLCGERTILYCAKLTTLSYRRFMSLS